MSTGNSEFTQAFFDESSAAWHANKLRVGAMYVYMCEGLHKNGSACRQKAVQKLGNVTHLCLRHSSLSTPTKP